MPKDENLKLKHSAYESVKDASNWMIDLRKAAPKEGFGPWGDGFTDYKQGVMNTAEGLTTMFLVNEYNEREKLGLPVLDKATLIKDLKWLISSIEKEGYTGTPYLKKESTENFTDAVSFVLSSFLGTYKIVEGDPKEEVKKHIENATKWFLFNKIEKEGTCGWSWMGSEEMKKREVEYPPQTYFTYSALIPLCDVLSEAEVVISEFKDDIIEIIQRAKNFLIKYNRLKNGWIAFTPTDKFTPLDYDEIEPKPHFISTCYAVLALTTIKNRVKNIEFSADDEKVIHDAMNWIHDLVGKKVDKLFAYTTSYICTSAKELYFDGTTPYTLLNTLTEYFIAYPDKREDYKKFCDDLVKEAITKCWGGTGYGFKHFVSKDPDDKGNIIAIYATAAAIETFLSFGIERPPEVGIEDIIKEELEVAQRRIVERLKKLGVPKIEKRSIVKETFATINKIVETIDDEWPILSGEATKNLPRGDLMKWQQYGKKANTEKLQSFLNELLSIENQNDFKSKINNFRDDYEKYLFEPCEKAIQALLTMSGEEIRENRVRVQKMLAIMKELQNEIEGKTKV